MDTATPIPGLLSLAETAAPFRDHFNRLADVQRLVALVSPT